ncbi:uncharacterized protein LOC116851833 isoform X1 [Odontomachus brunneus]|nr:uncharacterized protein LOC116851833 isoform X1 [Odontomachus brunneus]
MCAISAPPEAGDASAIMSTRRKYSAISEDLKNVSLSREDKNVHVRCVPTTPLNSIPGSNVYEEYALSRNDSWRRTSGDKHDVIRYGFPYYRSNRSNTSGDAVLLKDVGVSCRLLNDSADDPDMPISGFESYLVRQLKLEYNELSSITKKINAYTKDILNNLASRCRKKDHVPRKLHVVSKHVMASQYTDEAGNPCLKLRFCDNAEKKCGPIKYDINNDLFEKETAKETHGKHTNTKKRRVQPDKAFPKRILELSPKCSGLLLRNYLLMRREKVSSASKASLRKAEDTAQAGRLFYGAYKSCRSFYASKCNPLVLTNWKEVSRRKEYRSKSAFTASTSDESHCTVSCI